MYYTMSTKIYGDRTVFGYTGLGAGNSTGICSAYDAIQLINEDYKDCDWKYAKWDNDIFILDFERKVGNNQLIETVVLQPEAYAEFLVLKEWEKDNGFI